MHLRKAYFVAAFCALVASGKAEAASTDPLLARAFDGNFRAVPIGQVPELIPQIIASGVFGDIPVVPQSGGSLSSVLRALHFFEEPYSPEMLNALERNFGLEGSPIIKAEAAKILYRYGRPRGREYLLTLLAKNDVNAATVLALNRDTACLDGILRTFAAANRGEEDDTNPPELVMALGRWRNPRITAALFQQARIALANEQGGYLNYATALAQQDAKQAVVLLWKYYESVQDEDRATVAAALIKLRVKESPQLWQYLEQRLQAREKQFSRARLIPTIGAIETPAARKTLCSLIEKYLSAAKAPRPKPGTAIEVTAPEEIAVLAAEQLVGYTIPGSRNSDITNLLKRLLMRINKESDEAVLEQRAALALLRADRASAPSVEKIMGPEWLKKQAILSKLKPLAVVW